MRFSAVIWLGAVSALASLAQDSAPDPAQELDQHTIKSNLQYRLSRGDLPEISFGIEKPKNVEVLGGAGELLKSCLSDSHMWAKDPLMFRLGHTHATEILSCREKSSPAMHAVFRKVPGKPLRAWMDFDGHGSQTSGSRMVHFGEFIYHKFTLRTNDQDRMFDNLQRSFSNSLQASPDPEIPLSGHERFTLFTSKTLTRAQPYATSVVSSAFQLFSPNDVWGRGTDGFTNHVVASFTERLVTYGLQTGAAAALHEDLRYKPSNSSNVWRRTRHALLSTVVLEAPRGNDVAFGDIVAALGSGIVINTLHPGRETSARPGVWNLTAFNMIGFAQGNLWNEFKPDIKHLIRSKLLHRN
jgi:hypothetical protein